MKQKTKTCPVRSSPYFTGIIFFILIIIVTVLNLPQKALAAGETITTVTIIEKAGVTTQNYPLTFAIPFKKGDVTAGIKVIHEGVTLPTQFDIKRTWADGSVKHGIISVVIPQVDANGTEILTIETGETNSSSGAMDKTAILATDVDSSIALTNMSGSGNPSSASASLRTAIASGNLDYWMQGPVCTEILEDTPVTPNDNLHARWEARFYPGTAFGMRISNVVESVNIQALGGSNYDVAISQGSSSPTQVYSFTGFHHSYGSRWRKTFWLGMEPPEVEIHYDTDYLSSTMMIPKFDTNISISQTDINTLVGVFNTKNGEVRGGSDIDGAGNIYRAFPMTGGRDELGIVPAWTAMYLLSYDNNLRRIMLGDGDISGQIAKVHIKETDPTLEFYGDTAVSINARPAVTLENLSLGVPALIGDVADTDSWNPDRSHQGSFAYIPYLITGEHYYLDELKYWASYDLAFQQYGRQGTGSKQNFSSYFPEGTAAGILYDQMRGVAWAARNINDAAAILPDTDVALSAYFKTKLSNTFKWLSLANTETSHGLHMLRVPRELYFDYSSIGVPYTQFIGPWMMDFNMIVYDDIIRKAEGINNLSDLITLRDRVASFEIGRVTHHPEFNKWDGAQGYYWPLADETGTNYYSAGSWSELWDDCLALDGSSASIAIHQLPSTGFNPTQIGDGMQRLYIYKAALAGLTNLPNGAEAYDFVSAPLLTAQIARNPQWGGLIPDSTNISIDTTSPTSPSGLAVW